MLLEIGLGLMALSMIAYATWCFLPNIELIVDVMTLKRKVRNLEKYLQNKENRETAFDTRGDWEKPKKS